MTRMMPATRKHSDSRIGTHTNMWRTHVRCHHLLAAAPSSSSSFRSSSSRMSDSASSPPASPKACLSDEDPRPPALAPGLAFTPPVMEWRARLRALLKGLCRCRSVSARKRSPATACCTTRGDWDRMLAPSMDDVAEWCILSCERTAACTATLGMPSGSPARPSPARAPAPAVGSVARKAACRGCTPALKGAAPKPATAASTPCGEVDDSCCLLSRRPRSSSSTAASAAEGFRPRLRIG
mmetsp:Transcript_13606/g.41129  ORF Transcript_13606/g.41129 Transcript_13606/m.41129 type:complete len:239 (+) Transcript_13606:872-1588(+)